MGPHSAPFSGGALWGYLMSVAHRGGQCCVPAMCMRAVPALLGSIQPCHAMGCSITPLGCSEQCWEGGGCGIRLPGVVGSVWTKGWDPQVWSGMVGTWGCPGCATPRAQHPPPHLWRCPPPHSVQFCLQQLLLLYCGGCNTDVSSKACSSASPSLGIAQPPQTPTP